MTLSPIPSAGVTPPRPTTAQKWDKEPNMPLKCKRRLVWLTCVIGGLAAFGGSGCTPANPNAPVDAAKARETLRTALESWKKGEASTALEKASPPIYIIDPEWQSGVRLTDYQILGDGDEKDAHLFCKVRLKVRGLEGKESQQEATFIISTAPNLTVSRKFF